MVTIRLFYTTTNKRKAPDRLAVGPYHNYLVRGNRIINLHKVFCNMSESNSLKIYPMMSLRDIVVFPHMVAPLVVGREKSIKALEKAMAEGPRYF